MKTLEAWLSWQETLHPQEIELGLERIRPVAEALDLLNPTATVITVAGTNGKGSTIAILRALAEAAGLQVGCYTSPHLVRYNERILINGEAASDVAICNAFEAIDQARGEISLTYFEFGTLAALYLFQQQPLDLWLLEVGLGGRLDAVNLIDADVALLTTVDLDHQAWLGEDRESIGREKAGIFRSETPAIIGELSPPHSVIDHAAALGTPLYRYGVDFGVEMTASQWDWWSQNRRYDALPLPTLPGAIQCQNSAAALMAFETLGWLEKLSSAHVAKGLQQVQLQGRFQQLEVAPALIVDVSHNPQAVDTLANHLQQQPSKGQTIAVVGMLRDKEVGRVISTLQSAVDRWIAVGLDGNRALPAEEMMREVMAVTDEAVIQQPTVVEGVALARTLALPEDRILVFGSFYTVAAVLEAQ